MTGQRFVKKLRQCQRVIAALDSSFDLRGPSTQHDIIADIIQPLHSHRFTKGGEGGKCNQKSAGAKTIDYLLRSKSLLPFESFSLVINELPCFSESKSFCKLTEY